MNPGKQGMNDTALEGRMLVHFLEPQGTRLLQDYKVHSSGKGHISVSGGCVQQGFSV